MDIEKYRVELNLDALGTLALRPPRRRLWDLLPERLALWLIRRGYNPKPTPYELWCLDSAALRLYYSQFYGVVSQLHQQSAADRVAAFLKTSPGSSELN